MATENNVIKLTFLGDVMCKSQMISAYEYAEGKYNFDNIFAHMKSYFDKADYVMANMETPISFDNTELTVEKYNFNSPHEFAEAAYNAGIDFVATANNHCLDRGILGLNSTIKSLNDIGFNHTGVFSEEYSDMPLIVNIQGVKLGLMAYTYGTNAFSNNNYLKKKDMWRVNLFQNQELSNKIDKYIFGHRSSLIAKALLRFRWVTDSINKNRKPYERIENNARWRKKIKVDINKIQQLEPDFIIMYMHAGGQYNPEATIETKRMAQWLVDNGIDIVVGSHEHVVHGGDFSNISNNKLITYSLGNFDGIAGIYEEPYDKMAEYSISWNVYIDKASKKISKTTYSILKTIKESNEMRIQTIPVYDLYNKLSTEEKETLWKDIKIIAHRFSGRDIEMEGLCEEYSI